MTPEGVQISVTLADGTQQSVSVSGELEDGVPTVEAEVGSPSDDDESDDDDHESEIDDDHEATAAPAAPAGHGGPEGQTGDD